MQYPYPNPYPPPPPAQKSNTWIIVLVIVGGVLLLGVVGILVLAGLGIYGTRRYVAASKTAEAHNTVGMIARDAQMAYEMEAYDPTLIYGSASSISHKLCPSASQPVPRSLSMVRGTKYQSSVADWDVDAPNGGFACLKFEMWEPQYYQYDYQATGDGTHPGDRFTASAKGDLDDDGKSSSFEIVGTVTGTTVTLGTMTEKDPDE